MLNQWYIFTVIEANLVIGKAVVIYPSRSTEQAEKRPYRGMLGAGQIHQIYLDELGEFSELPLEVSVLVLTCLKERETPEAARYLVKRTQQEVEGDRAKRAIIETIGKILSYRFTNLSSAEIETMLGISFEQTRLYHDLVNVCRGAG